MRNPRTVAWVPFVLVVIGSALAMGGVDTPVLVAVCVLAASACVTVWATEEPFVPRTAATTLAIVGAGLLVMTLIQTIPLPMSVLRVLSPHAADVWARALHPLGMGEPRFASLSLDPTATRIEVMKGAVYLATFLTTLALSRRRAGAAHVLRILIAGGAALALVTAIHYGMNWDRPYGFYRPHTGVSAVAPLMNVNHLAGYFNVALLVALGSSLSSSPVAPRPLLLTLVVVIATIQFRLASRGAIAAMLVGVALVATLALRARRSAATPWRSGTLLGFFAACLLAMISFPGALRVVSDHDASKLTEVLHVLRRMVPEYALLGAGRGAFESTYPEFREGTGFVVWTHPENILAQWSSEWGVPVTLVTMGAIVWSLRPAVLLRSTTPMIGAWSALAALALHNTVDFNSEIPTVGIAGSVCAALVVSGSSGRAASRAQRWASHPRAVALGAAAMAVVAFLLVVTRTSELLAERESFVAIAEKDALSPTEFDAKVELAIRAHPAEPYFPYVAAVYALRHRTNEVVKWIDATLARAPVYPPAHLVLARVLRTRFPSQARLEYRLYAEQSGGAVLDINEIIGLVASFEDAKELATPDPAGDEVLDQLATRLAERLPATRRRIDEDLLGRNPLRPNPLRRVAEDALLDVVDASWCEEGRAACVTSALELTAAAEAAAPTQCSGYIAHATAIELSGDPGKALTVLEEAESKVTDRAPCVRRFVQLADASGASGEGTAAIDRLSHASCGLRADCVDNLVAASEIEAGRGNVLRAVGLLRRAWQVAPDEELVGARLAAQASVAGLHAESADVFGSLAQRYPQKDYAAAAARERSLAVGTDWSGRHDDPVP